MDLRKLLDPFDPTEIEWRISRSGFKSDKPWAKVLAYVTNRAIMDRLDAVCGPENWCNRFEQAPGGGVLCGLSIRIGDEWVTKYDGADATNIEAVKGGLSGAMKRAAVQWGIGRYLYQLDEGFAEFVDKGRGQYTSPIKTGKKTSNGKDEVKYCAWNPPQLPAFALPGFGDDRKQPETRGARDPVDEFDANRDAAVALWKRGKAIGMSDDDLNYHKEMAGIEKDQPISTGSLAVFRRAIEAAEQEKRKAS